MKKSRIGKGIAVLLVMAGLVAGMYGVWQQYPLWRGHGRVDTAGTAFTESASRLYNPNRGFYHMHGFRIEEEEVDFQSEIKKRFQNDKSTRLTLIEINLQYFREGPISEKGLANLDNLLQALESTDKQWILRFLYDWHGENQQYEPQSRSIIETHMQQVEPYLAKYADRIFLLQGLFIGNWGEMNGTQYLETEDLQALARQLEAVTPQSTFLSVRMPAQWRKITQLGEAELVKGFDLTLSSRLGLYNDGMLGSWSDYGTYGDHTKAEHGSFTYWNREEELAFQEILCSYVPNGGEVIVDNTYNDFENALQDMKRMHITYLNSDYDTKVLEKWENTFVTEEGCFQGMDGLSYMERHLGYRLVLRNSQITYDLQRDSLLVQVFLQNVGFAPVYRETIAEMVLENEEDKSRYICRAVQDSSNGKNGSADAEKLSADTEKLSADAEEPASDAEKLSAYTEKLSADAEEPSADTEEPSASLQETVVDVRSLPGGNDTDKTLKVEKEYILTGMKPGTYHLYLVFRDALTGEVISFGNEEEMQEYGYYIGSAQLQGTETFWDAVREELEQAKLEQ